MKKYKKVPLKNEYQKFLKKTPSKKNNNAKYNHKQILDNCKKKNQAIYYVKIYPKFYQSPQDTEHH